MTGLLSGPFTSACVLHANLLMLEVPRLTPSIPTDIYCRCYVQLSVIWRARRPSLTSTSNPHSQAPSSQLKECITRLVYQPRNLMFSFSSNLPELTRQSPSGGTWDSKRFNRMSNSKKTSLACTNKSTPSLQRMPGRPYRDTPSNTPDYRSTCGLAGT